MAKLLFFVSEDWYFVSHRLPLAREAVRRGWDVVVVTRVSSHRALIEGSGVRVIPFEVDRRSLSPGRVIREALALSRIYRGQKPDVVHHVALRPIVVGGLAARFAGLSAIVAAITGLGYLFTDAGRGGPLQPLVRLVLSRLLGRGIVLVQNRDDGQAVEALGVDGARVALIPGVGVDPARYRRSRHDSDRPVVMLAARLLWDKGVKEFVEAARLLRESGARFVLVGRFDPDNPTAVPQAEVERWVGDGVVEYWGYSEDMPGTLARADIFCLPSYREGLPMVALEAMASSLPCVLTDVPGCRDVLIEGRTGLLVPPRQGAGLARALEQLIVDADLRKTMGANGREHVVASFAQDAMIEMTFALYDRVAGKPGTG